MQVDPRTTPGNSDDYIYAYLNSIGVAPSQPTIYEQPRGRSAAGDLLLENDWGRLIYGAGFAGILRAAGASKDAQILGAVYGSAKGQDHARHIFDGIRARREARQESGAVERGTAERPDSDEHESARTYPLEGPGARRLEVDTAAEPQPQPNLTASGQTIDQTIEILTAAAEVRGIDVDEGEKLRSGRLNRIENNADEISVKLSGKYSADQIRAAVQNLRNTAEATDKNPQQAFELLVLLQQNGQGDLGVNELNSSGTMPVLSGLADMNPAFIRELFSENFNSYDELKGAARDLGQLAHQERMYQARQEMPSGRMQRDFGDEGGGFWSRMGARIGNFVKTPLGSAIGGGVAGLGTSLILDKVFKVDNPYAHGAAGGAFGGFLGNRWGQAYAGGVAQVFNERSGAVENVVPGFQNMGANSTVYHLNRAYGVSHETAAQAGYEAGTHPMNLNS